jgi:hypothetical protein
MDQNWTWREVQLPFEPADNVFIFYIECQLGLLGQGSTYWSKDSHTFEQGSGSFQASRRLVTRNWNNLCLFELINNAGTVANS